MPEPTITDRDRELADRLLDNCPAISRPAWELLRERIPKFLALRYREGVEAGRRETLAKVAEPWDRLHGELVDPVNGDCVWCFCGRMDHTEACPVGVIDGLLSDTEPPAGPGKEANQ